MLHLKYPFIPFIYLPLFRESVIFPIISKQLKKTESSHLSEIINDISNANLFTIILFSMLLFNMK